MCIAGVREGNRVFTQSPFRCEQLLYRLSRGPLAQPFAATENGFLPRPCSCTLGFILDSAGSWSEDHFTRKQGEAIYEPMFIPLSDDPRGPVAWALLWVGATASAEPDPRTRARIEALEKILPEYEKAADTCEKELQEFRESKDEAVQTAADAARLRIECVRSMRDVIARDPTYLIWHLPDSTLRDWKEGMAYYLKCAGSKIDPFEGKTSGIRTVRSPTDGQLLFYVFRLPKDYDPSHRYPLDVSLHAGAGLTWRAGWVDGLPSDDPARAEKSSKIWISPCGRGNNCYAGMGESAVFDAIADVKRHYRVDEDRVVIGGASMGGTGGFRLAALRPDVFAAAYSLTGGANYSVPVGNGRFDATLLIDNFCNTGMCIWDAPKEGWYTQNHAFAEGLRERGQKHGGYPHIELTDPNGTHGVIDPRLQDEGWAWFAQSEAQPLPQTSRLQDLVLALRRRLLGPPRHCPAPRDTGTHRSRVGRHHAHSGRRKRKPLSSRPCQRTRRRHPRSKSVCQRWRRIDSVCGQDRLLRSLVRRLGSGFRALPERHGEEAWPVGPYSTSSWVPRC